MASNKPNKPRRVTARVPRGFVDRSADDLRAQDAMLARIRGVYERYGFEPVETPVFEYTDALGKFLPDSDRPNEGVFSIEDDDEQWMSLRYDLTAPLARHVAENYENLPKPYRSYRAGYVFRNEKPGPGRFRQFMQFDADIVGAPNVSADAEMAMMMADTMEALGIPRGQYVIRVNNRKVLDGLLEAIGLGGEENAGRRLTVLRAMDKFDKFGYDGVRLLLGDGRWDGGRQGEGDFTLGAGLSADKVDIVLKTLTSEGAWATPAAAEIKESDDFEAKKNYAVSELEKPEFADEYKLKEKAGWYYNNLAAAGALEAELGASVQGLEGIEELQSMAAMFKSAGYGSQRIRINSKEPYDRHPDPPHIARIPLERC